MPAARYSFGETVLPVWPIWAAYGYQPASTTARVAATALLPPNALASASASSKPSALPRPRPPATRMSAPSMSTSAPRCSPRLTIVAWRRPGRVLDVDVDDLGVVGVGGVRLVDLERVDPADDDPQVAPVVRDRDLGVLQDRALGDELAVLGADRGDLHRHAGLLARGQAGADLEAEQAAAEQRVAVAVVVDHLGHHVDDRLRQALGALGAEHLRGAVVGPASCRGRRSDRHRRRRRRGTHRRLAARAAPSDTAPSEFLLNAPS